MAPMPKNLKPALREPSETNEVVKSSLRVTRWAAGHMSGSVLAQLLYSCGALRYESPTWQGWRRTGSTMARSFCAPRRTPSRSSCHCIRTCNRPYDSPSTPERRHAGLPFFFWSGHGSLKAGNPRLHSNYRSRIQGVCCKHDAKWSRSRQARISELLGRIWYTKIWYTKKLVRKWKKTKRIILVDEMGFEPTTPALRTPCTPS
jgi:hypothetical protein